jgi:hypothetical protein
MAKSEATGMQELQQGVEGLDVGVIGIVTVECVILNVCPPYLETDWSLSFLRRHFSLLFRQFLSYGSVKNLVAHPVGCGSARTRCWPSLTT